MINKKRLVFLFVFFGVMALIGYGVGSYYQKLQQQQVKTEIMREAVHTDNMRRIIYRDMPAKEREIKEFLFEGEVAPATKKTDEMAKLLDNETDDYDEWLKTMKDSGEMDEHAKSPDNETDEYDEWFNKTMMDSGEMNEIVKLIDDITENQDNPKKLAQLEAELASKEDVILGQRKKFVDIMYGRIQVEQATARMEASSDDYSNLVEYHKYLETHGSKDDVANIEKLLKDAMSDDLLSIKESDEIRSFYSTTKKRISASKLKGIDS